MPRDGFPIISVVFGLSAVAFAVAAGANLYADPVSSLIFLTGCFGEMVLSGILLIKYGFTMGSDDSDAGEAE